MSPELESQSDEGWVRSALNALANDAQTEPSHPLRHRGTTQSPENRRPGRGYLIAAAAAAAATLVAVAAVSLVGPGQDDNIVAGPPTASDVTDPPAADVSLFVELSPDTAMALPDAPISGRIGPAAVWTGQEMIVWGGSDLVDGSESPLSDGAAFSPSTGLWRVLPSAPVEGRAYAATIWTGSEMVVWGGSQNGTFVDDGAAYDPATDTWRVLSDAPLEPAMKSATTWTGSEMIIVSGLNRDGSSAAYDPAGDRWREMPDAPGPVTPPYPQAVWTGEAVLTTIVTAGSVISSTRLAMYRPDVDEWEIVEDQFVSQWLVGVPGVDLGMVGDEVVALTMAPDVSLPVLSLFGDVGFDLQPKPADFAQIGFWQPIWTGHEILLWSGGSTGLALDPLADQWREYPAGDIASRTSGAIVWADGVLIAWGGFVTDPDGGSAGAANDGIMYRPVNSPNSVAASAPLSTPPIDTLDGCPKDHPGTWTPGPDGFTDYIDFVRLNGRNYDIAAPTQLSPDTLGDQVGQVCFTLGDMTFEGAAPIQDGDASFLPVGVTLQAIPGGDPTLRIAAVVDNRVVVYEVSQVENAVVGADLIDLGTNLTEIGVNSDLDGRRLASITDPETVNQLAELLAEAPVDLSPQPESERNGQRYFIELVRADGTSTTRAYWIETGELHPGINLPPEWRSAVENVL